MHLDDSAIWMTLQQFEGHNVLLMPLHTLKGTVARAQIKKNVNLVDL